MMKRLRNIFCILLILVMLFPTGMAEAKENGLNQKSVFKFPASLLFIGEEAFTGTLATTVVFQNGLLVIGHDAFAGANSLTDIFIPPTTVYIADTAIPMNRNIVIHGTERSYTQSWANEHNLPFVVENIWDTGQIGGKIIKIRDGVTDRSSRVEDVEKPAKPIGSAENKERSMRPQDRPELNPIDYRFP